MISYGPMKFLGFVGTWMTQQLTLLEICEEQRELIAQLQHMRERDDLEHIRFQRDLMATFRLALDQSDLDEVAEAIEKAISDLSDHVARLEEHLVK